MTEQETKELALANGFKLKEQPGGQMDLNPYVYDFARALLQAAQQKQGYVKAATVREAVIAGWELSAEGHNSEYCDSNQSDLNCMFDQATAKVLKAAQEPT